ncbi:hypothetical protein ES705_08167 [subsurface metagenome]
MKNNGITIGFAFLCLLTDCKVSDRDDSKTITVFCATGLMDTVTEVGDSFTCRNEVDFRFNTASSGALARQITQGYETDIYISASDQWTSYVESLGIFICQKPLCQNKLVLIAPRGSSLETIDFQKTKSIADLFQGYLSMGDPAHVPAGLYAFQALNTLGWYGALEKRVLPAKDVRSAFLLVELGECELGIVYYSDAVRSEKVKILGTFPENTHNPIIFYGLLNKKASGQAIQFYNFLTNESMDGIWYRNGLIPVITETL